ncbi:MAG: GatB/YqeY domain-containing protein [Candidatus Moraniibacteriota bacterium]|nr:MAG: GatB/YqeY domain-containing protein [Candidatus Moranbacteria bacterium]
MSRLAGCVVGGSGARYCIPEYSLLRASPPPRIPPKRIHPPEMRKFFIPKKPMALITQIGDELKAAMKAGEVVKRDTLRFFQSALKNAAIEARKPVAEFTDAEVEAVAKKLVKQRKDSIAQYQAAGRADLVEKERAELVFIEAYLPAQLSREAVEAAVEKVLAAMPDATVKDMGRVMGAVMKETVGAADGNLVRELVSAKLK